LKKIRVKRGARAQASAISVAILVAATLVLSLLLYSYYSSMYGELNRKSQIELFKIKYLSGLDSTVIYSWKNITTTSSMACYIIKFINSGDYPVIVRYSVLPLIQQLNSVIPSSLIYKVPRDVDTGNTVVHVFYVEDLDGDGLIELVGGNGVNLTWDTIPTCQDILNPNNNYITNSIAPAIDVPSDNLIITDELPLSALAKNITSIPVWETSIDVGKTKHVLLAINATVPLTELDLVLFVRVDNNYIVVETLELP
jgi:hypothetical protein